MTAVAGLAQGRKSCIKCGADVTGRKRFRNVNNEYYCESCYAAGQTEMTSVQPAVAATEVPDHATARALGLLPTVTCPHCWHQFPPSQILWIAHHSDLVGDPVLGPEKARRFLPTRFTPDGQAIDARGAACQNLACPRCHLIIPRSVIELEPLFLSVVGGPKTGKSYFLASMTWELRRQMPSEFGLSFTDADTESNQTLSDYEGTLFLAPDPTKLVAIEKTEEQGGKWYEEVNLGGQIIKFTRPFLFNIRPTTQHPHAEQRTQYSRLLCMYDNAGEHFQPGRDTAGSPVTQHLARSRALMFLFDPTQDPRFREQCKTISADPQLGSARNTIRQETLLVEASLRVRRYTNLPPNAKHRAPLIMIVPKSDVWGGLLPGEDLVSEPVLHGAVGGRLSAVDTNRIERVSAKLRTLLERFTPEMVAAAEDFCQHVIYIPVSALGCSPEETLLGEGPAKGLFVRPAAVKPHWAAVPVTYMLSKWASGLVAHTPALPPAHMGSR